MATGVVKRLHRCGIKRLQKAFYTIDIQGVHKVRVHFTIFIT